MPVRLPPDRTVAASPAAANPRPQRGGPSRRRFRVITALLTLWLLGGAVLALRTANPVTLNAEQIERADLVVTGTVEDGNQIAVDREWKRGLDLGTIRVANLSDAGIQVGRRYIVPLSVRDETDYRVTITRQSGLPPAAYPAADHTLGQLRELLERLSPRSASSRPR